MIFFLVRRLGTALVVAWLALTLAFVVLRWLPGGDAIDATLTRSGVPLAEVEARREKLGLNDPIPRQYADYVAGVARGDWGDSLVSGQSVSSLIVQNAGPTLVLAASALLVAAALGVSLGVTAGAAPWPPLRNGALVVASLALSTPVYWTATLAIYFFTVEFHLLPGVSGSSPRHLILPACVLGFHTAGSIAQMTHSAVREAAAADFVRTARAKGLPEWDVLDHILRVGLLPVIAVIALQLGFLLSGTVVTEIIFVRPGLGRVLLNAIDLRDYPVIQGLVTLSALVYSLIGALADIIYRLLDPRLERSV